MTHSRFATLDELTVTSKRILLRVDFNVPILNNEIIDDSRILATLPTIQKLVSEGAAVILLSHRGRPEEGKCDSQYSLDLIADYLSEALNSTVPLITNWHDADVCVEFGEVALLENIRFEEGEKDNADDLARTLANLCDIYVNEAFASSHREQASVHCIIKYKTIIYAGPLFVAETEALQRCIDETVFPLVAIIGGRSRAAVKFDVINAMLDKADHLLLGGFIANTFLKAMGHEIGYSTFYSTFVSEAKRIINSAMNKGKPVFIPTDVLVRKKIASDKTQVIEKPIEDILPDDIIVDIGSNTINRYIKIIESAATIFWSGSPGIFERPECSNGTRKLAMSIAGSEAFSLVGGGDTLAAISKFNLREKISFLSTGGEALLEYVQGKQLPGISMLEESARIRYAIEREY